MTEPDIIAFPADWPQCPQAHQGSSDKIWRRYMQDQKGLDWLVAWGGWNRAPNIDLFAGVWYAYPLDKFRRPSNDRYCVHVSHPGGYGGHSPGMVVDCGERSPQDFVTLATDEETKWFWCGVNYALLTDLVNLIDWNTTERLDQKPNLVCALHPENLFYTQPEIHVTYFFSQQYPGAGGWLKIPKYKAVWDDLLRQEIARHLHPKQVGREFWNICNDCGYQEYFVPSEASVSPAPSPVSCRKCHSSNTIQRVMEFEDAAGADMGTGSFLTAAVDLHCHDCGNITVRQRRSATMKCFHCGSRNLTCYQRAV